MSMVINTNTASLIAQQAQTATSKAMDTAMERLSTGKRINSASDDAAGMAMSSRMESQIVGLAAAMRNAGDAQSLINTAEGSYNEVTNILNRMRELAVQAANDTNVASDRVNLQSEITQLNSEINRIASQTTWNGMNLLDGTFSNKQFQIGSESGQTVALNVTDTSATALGSYNFEAVGGLYLENAGVSVSGASTDPGDYTVLGPKGTSTVAVNAGDSAKEFAAAMNAVTSTTGVTASAVTKVLLSTGSLATAAVDDTPAIADGTTVNSLKINGVTVLDSSNTASISSTDFRDLRDKINDKSAQTGVTAKMGATNTAIILTDADGDDIVLDAFDTSANGSMLGVQVLKADETVAGAVNGDDEAEATDKYGNAATLMDPGGSAADQDQVVISGSTTLSATGGFSVTGGEAYDSTNADNNPHIKAASVAGTLSTVSALNISTATGAASAITTIDGAINMVTSNRAELGAISNRLDFAMANLTNTKVNMEASQSRIQDADFAVETSNLTKAQILSQAATAMLAQANASKQSVLSLLQG